MFESGDPSEKRKKAATWARLDMKETPVVNAWIAGPTVWVLCHHYGVSIPCHHELTKGALHCPHCGVLPMPDWVGYVPLYSDSGRQCFTQVKHYAKDIIKKLKHKDAVRVRKGKAKTDPIIVEPSKWSPAYEPTRDDRIMPADIKPFLVFVLWKQKALIDFYSGDQPELTPEQDEVVKAMEDKNRADAKLLGMVKNRLVVKPPAVSSLDDTIDDLAKAFPNLGAALSNGKHPPPTED